MATSTEKTTAKGPNSPVWKMALKGVHAAVFTNESENGVFFKTTITRVYKDGEEFKTTNSYSRDDLPVVQLLSDKAYEFILDAEANQNKGEE